MTVGRRDEREKRADATYRVAVVADTVQNAEVVFVALPYDALATALSPLAGALSGKILRRLYRIE